MHVRIAAALSDPHPNVEQFVIRLVLTDHEVVVAVMPWIAIDVMNLGTIRKKMPQRLLGNRHVRINLTGSRRLRMGGTVDFDVKHRLSLDMRLHLE